eukprot:626747-Prorocentrum_minimum.AAC.1
MLCARQCDVFAKENSVIAIMNIANLTKMNEVDLPRLVPPSRNVLPFRPRLVPPPGMYSLSAGDWSPLPECTPFPPAIGPPSRNVLPFRPRLARGSKQLRHAAR